MAAFAKASFNARLYSASRPTYPQQLFDFIFRYHEGARVGEPKFSRTEYRRAVDLGCGTGQATLGLLPFEEIIAVDPSKSMTETARMHIDQELEREGKGKMKDKFNFKNASAEELPFLDNASVDFVIAAQAAHWFDFNKLWPELARILRSNGTVAILGYSEMRFTCYRSLTPLIEAYTHGTDPATSLGPHWQQPGRSIVENLLCDIPEARLVVNNFKEERRIYFSGPHTPSHLNDEDCRPVVLRKNMSWENFEAYLRSFSSLHTFQERYKNDAKHPDGDIVQRFIKTVKAEMQKTEPDMDTCPGMEIPELEKEMNNQKEVLIEWPLVLILAKRR